MLNCKPGDIARYVGRDPACYGYIVECVELHPTSPAGYPCWITRPPLPDDRIPGMYALGTSDAVLRPIRDSDGEDEMLRIAGKPQERDETLTPKPQVEHAR